MENFYRFFFICIFYVRVLSSVLSKENGVTFLENCQQILYKIKKMAETFSEKPRSKKKYIRFCNSKDKLK